MESTTTLQTPRAFFQGSPLERVEELYAGIHPGIILFDELCDRGVRNADFARAIGISRVLLSRLGNGTSPITPTLALLIGKALGQPPHYWLAQQAVYDLHDAEIELGERLEGVPHFGRRTWSQHSGGVSGDS